MYFPLTQFITIWSHHSSSAQLPHVAFVYHIDQRSSRPSMLEDFLLRFALKMPLIHSCKEEYDVFNETLSPLQSHLTPAISLPASTTTMIWCLTNFFRTMIYLHLVFFHSSSWHFLILTLVNSWLLYKSIVLENADTC